MQLSFDRRQRRGVLRGGTSAVGIAAGLVTGCSSYGAHLTAVPTPPGQREVTVHANAVVAGPGRDSASGPNAELGYRWGMARNIDVGVRGHGMGGEVNSRLRLVSSEGFDLTASPFVGGGLIPNHQDNAGALRFPMGMRALLGWHAPAGVDLTLGAVATFEPQAGLVGDDQRSQLLAAPGALLNAEVPLGETLRISLEVNAHLPYALGQGSWQSPILQGGVALKWSGF